MEVTKSISNMDFGIIIELTEQEARALEAITLYGVKNFLDVFYQHLGKHYLEPHEEGIKILFSTLKTEMPKHLRKMDKIRKVWIEETLKTIK